MTMFNGKSVIVLGAAGKGNMGQEIARAFAREGAKVTVAGRNQAELESLASEIAGQARICDITSKDDLEALVSAAIEAYGKVDVGINATGINLARPFVEYTTDELKKMCDVQFTGPFQFFQALLKEMAEGGSIIQISSALATIMIEDNAAYMGTKAGIDHVIRTIANEFGSRGIRANSIAPALTATPMAAPALAVPALKQLFADASPLGRIAEAEDIAEACLWVASNKCFMTGQVFQVNGGVTLRRNPTGKEMQQAVEDSAG